MTSDQLQGILRAVLAAVGGFVLAKGWLPADTWNWIVGGVVVAAPAVWSWFSNRPSTHAALTQAMPGVEVTTSAAAPAAVAAAVSAVKATQ